MGYAWGAGPPLAPPHSSGKAASNHRKFKSKDLIKIRIIRTASAHTRRLKAERSGPVLKPICVFCTPHFIRNHTGTVSSCYYLCLFTINFLCDAADGPATILTATIKSLILCVHQSNSPAEGDPDQIPIELKAGPIMNLPSACWTIRISWRNLQAKDSRQQSACDANRSSSSA